MTSIGILIGSQTPLYRAENNELITKTGTYAFSQLVDSTEFELDTGACSTVLVVRSTRGASATLATDNSADTVYDADFEHDVAAGLVRQGESSLNAASMKSSTLLQELDSAPHSTVSERSVVVRDIASNSLELAAGRYRVIGDEPRLTPSEAGDRLQQPMASDMRVSTSDSGFEIIEVCNNDHLVHASALLRAVVEQADYLPYRDDALSKLLLFPLCSKKKSLTVVVCIPTHAIEALQPALAFCSLVSQWSTATRPRYAAANSDFALSPTDLKSGTVATLNELLLLYAAELQREHVLKSEAVNEAEAKAARVRAEQRSAKTEEIRALDRDLRLLEVQVSVLQTSTASKSQGSWLSTELEHKQRLLTELRAEAAKLAVEIASAKKFEVGEPFRSLIRQSEFNLQSLRLRLQALHAKRTAGPEPEAGYKIT